MRKLIFIIICLVFYSNTHSQESYFGARLQAAVNSYGSGVGGGLHVVTNINCISSVRLLFEGGIITLNRPSKENYPLVTLVDYQLYQIKAQYLHHFPINEVTKWYVGAGIGGHFYDTGMQHHGILDGQYTSEQSLGNTVELDIILGIRVSEHVNAEVNYNFSYPELTSNISEQTGEYVSYKSTRTVNMNTVYLNLIFSVSTLDL